VRLLPALLREGHDRTFATGKWHNGEPSCVRAFPRSKSLFFGGMADHTKVPVADVRDSQVVNRRIAEKFSSEQFADAAVDFLKSRSGDGPFCGSPRGSSRSISGTNKHQVPSPCRLWYDRAIASGSRVHSTIPESWRDLPCRAPQAR